MRSVLLGGGYRLWLLSWMLLRVFDVMLLLLLLTQKYWCWWMFVLVGVARVGLVLVLVSVAIARLARPLRTCR